MLTEAKLTCNNRRRSFFFGNENSILDREYWILSHACVQERKVSQRHTRYVREKCGKDKYVVDKKTLFLLEKARADCVNSFTPLNPPETPVFVFVCCVLCVFKSGPPPSYGSVRDDCGEIPGDEAPRDEVPAACRRLPDTGHKRCVL